VSLSAKDLLVVEDGVIQEVESFEEAVAPISIAMVVDTSGSMRRAHGVAQQAARSFVTALRPSDPLALVRVSDRVVVEHEYSERRQTTLDAIGRLEAVGGTALFDALYDSMAILKKRAGRRAIVLLSDGEDTASLVSDEQVLELARKSEIAIYAISLRPNRVAERNRQQFSQATHLLTALSRETGGQVYFPNSISELDTVYDRIAEELRTQYSLGYESSNGRRDGKWRRVVVRTPSREGLRVRHKIGYYAPRS
jgi:VWFA-related protein